MFQVKENGALYSVTVNQMCAQCGRVERETQGSADKM